MAKMDIDALLIKQNELVTKDQEAYQRMVKRIIRKYGITEKARAEIQKELKKMSLKSASKALELGGKWLNSYL